MYNPSAGDRVPRELNFFFGLYVTIDIGAAATPDFDDRTPYTILLYTGQGSNSDGNNWWVGSPAIAYRGSGAPIIPVTTEAATIREMFNITHSNKNAFGLQPWFGTTYRIPDQPDWLSGLAPSILISDINLPGTHDSAAVGAGGFWDPWSCHERTIYQQLMSGIRLLDIRLSVFQDAGGFYFGTAHGKGPVRGDFDLFASVLGEIMRFLDEHPDEFVAAMLKIEDWGGFEKQKGLVYDALAAQIDDVPKLISSGLPTLKEVRGKIYFLNRLEETELDDERFGPTIPAPKLDPSGQHFDERPPTRLFPLYIQDQYQWVLPYPSHDAEKFRIWLAAMGHAESGELLVNFATAAQAAVFKVQTIGFILSYFGQQSGEKRPRSLGWSLFDFEDTAYLTSTYGPMTITQLMIASNFRYFEFPDEFSVSDNEG
ncbi:hypothetical protein [Bosea vaviloviae]|nr:hypothetical protein [Bosea vaviloviae]